MARRAGEKRGPGLREDKLGSIERQGLLLRGEGGQRNARCGRFTLVHLIKRDGGEPVCVCRHLLFVCKSVCVCQYTHNWQQRPLACSLQRSSQRKAVTQMMADVINSPKSISI